MKRRRTTADANRCLRHQCKGTRPVGGLGSYRERVLKNYLTECLKELNATKRAPKGAK